MRTVLDHDHDLMLRPLEGIRVLAVEQHGAAPFATLHLADLGAEVVKIEEAATGGDVGRSIGADDITAATFFATLNRGKRSVTLDLRSAQGQHDLHVLVGEADALVANLRPDVLDRLGLRYEALAEVNPRIVCCLLTAYGLTGPRRDEPGYDPVLQAVAGWMSQTGDPADPPTKSGLSLVDFHAGQTLATAVAAHVLGALRTGRGGEVDLSLFDVAVTALSYVGSWQRALGVDTPRRARSAHPSLAPVQMFATGEGWLVISAVKDSQWLELLRVVDRTDLAADARFADTRSRFRHRTVLQDELEDALAARSARDWEALLIAARVPSAAVRTVAEALEDPQVSARGLLRTTHAPGVAQPLICVGTPFARGADGEDRAPALGEDTAELLDRRRHDARPDMTCGVRTPRES